MLSAGAESAVEIRGDLLYFRDADVLRRVSIEGPQKLLGGNVPGGEEVHRLALGVHSGIRAAASRHRHVLPQKPLQRGLKFSLHRSDAGLDLPAAEPGAVVGDRKLPVFELLGLDFPVRQITALHRAGVFPAAASLWRQRLVHYKRQEGEKGAEVQKEESEGENKGHAQNDQRKYYYQTVAVPGVVVGEVQERKKQNDGKRHQNDPQNVKEIALQGEKDVRERPFEVVGKIRKQKFKVGGKALFLMLPGIGEIKSQGMHQEKEDQDKEDVKKQNRRENSSAKSDGKAGGNEIHHGQKGKDQKDPDKEKRRMPYNRRQKDVGEMTSVLLFPQEGAKKSGVHRPS